MVGDPPLAGALALDHRRTTGEDDAPFLAALEEVFAEAACEPVRWINELISDGEAMEDYLFLGRKA